MRSDIMWNDSGMSGFECRKFVMTPYLFRKVTWIYGFDTCVIVDNYVEMGDFFWILQLDEKSYQQEK